MLNMLYPGNRGLICRKESASLTKSTIKTLLEQVLPKELILSYNKSSGELYHRTPIPGVASSIFFSGLDKRADQSYPTKIGSTEYGWVFADEIVEFDESDFQMLITRLRYKIIGLTKEQNDMIPKQLFGATNPGSPLHFLYKTFFQEKVLNHEVIMMTPYENPYNTTEYIAQLEATLTGINRERLLLGKWVQAEGAIYDTFDYEKNVIEIDYINTITHYKYFFGGADSNFPIPRAGVILGVLPNGEIHILEEFYVSAAHPEQLGEWYSEFASKYFISIDVFHDPSDPEAIKKIDYYPGVNCEKAKNAVKPGIDCVYKYVDSGRLKINKKCVNTIKYLTNYRYKPGSDDEPEKKDDHLCVTGNTKITTLRGEINITDVTTDDYVLTRKGYKRVLFMKQTDTEATVHSIKFSNGKELICTGNHPIYVKDKGWVRADALRNIYILADASSYAWYQYNSMGANIIKQKGMVTGERMVAENICIEMSGCSLMVKYLRDITYTILMKTKIITIFQTLNAYLVRNIKKNILGQKNKSERIINNLKKSGHSQRSGTQAKKATNGIANTGTTPLRKSSKKENMSANNAENHLSAEPLKEQCSAIQTARPRISVKGIEKLKQKQSVYNLYVEDCHEYFANGILVSNCDAIRYALFTYDNSTLTEERALPVPI